MKEIKLYTCGACTKENTNINRVKGKTDFNRCSFCGVTNQSAISFYTGLAFKTVIKLVGSFLIGAFLSMFFGTFGYVVSLGYLTIRTILRITTYIKQSSISQEQQLRSNLENFNIDQVIAFNNYDFLIDRQGKELIVVAKENMEIRFHLDSILDFNYQMDVNTKVGGSMGRSLIGGMIGGTTGSIIGSSGSRKVTSSLESVTLQISTTDPLHPYHTLVLTELNQEVLEYKSALLRSQVMALSV